MFHHLSALKWTLLTTSSRSLKPLIRFHRFAAVNTMARWYPWNHRSDFVWSSIAPWQTWAQPDSWCASKSSEPSGNRRTPAGLHGLSPSMPLPLDACLESGSGRYRFPRLKPGFYVVTALCGPMRISKLCNEIRSCIHPRINPECSVASRLRIIRDRQNQPLMTAP